MLATPKLRGFRSLATKPAVVNVDDIERSFVAGATVTPRALVEGGLIRSKNDGVKVLGRGTVTKAFTLKGFTVSAPAKKKIEAAGGSVVKQQA
jgi:large subunit ribosomal protein L15